MHASVVMPLLESPEVTAETKQRIADFVRQQAAPTADDRKAA